MHFAVFSVFLVICSSVQPKSNVYWTNVTEGALFRLKSDPAGLFEGATKLYPCKMWADNRWITGNFFFLEGFNTSDCTVRTWGVLYRTKEFQVLSYPTGSISWVPSTGKYPDNVIYGGTHRDKVLNSVCRARVTNSVLVGLAYNGGSSCYMPSGDNEESVHDKRKIEILVENIYGTLFDENFPR